MQAKAKELWLIVECPYCQRPQTINKFLVRNKITSSLNRTYQCRYCEKAYTVTLEGELDGD